MRRLALLAGLLVALLAAGGLAAGDARAQVLYPDGYCDVPGGTQKPGGCVFQEECMPSTAGKCQAERDKRWQQRCTALGLKDSYNPQPGWEAFCREEAAVRNVKVPGQPPAASPTPFPSPQPTPTATPTPAPTATPTPAATAPPAPSAAPAPTAGQPGPTDVDTTDSRSIGCKDQDRCVTLARTYDLRRYGIDDHAESETFDPSTWFPAMLQWLNTSIWYDLLTFVDAVLRLLEWAFALDLFGGPGQNGLVTESSFANTLGSIFNALGSSWMTFGVLVAGAWAMWNGLVRMKTIETLGGLAGTLGLMLVALTVTIAPGKTVGELSRTINEAAGSAFAIASTATVSDSDDAQRKAHQTLFASLVQRPWCALQFGDPTKCNWEDDWDGDGRPEKLGDAYLKYDIGSSERTAVFEELVSRDNGKWSALQGLDNATPRFGLLALILVGLAGAIAMMVTLSVRLLLAVIEVLILLFFVPWMFVVAAFGAAGRTAAVNYGKRIVGRTADQFWVGGVTGAAILGSNTIEGVGGGFHNTWLLMCVYWWGLFVKRDDILGMFNFIDADSRGGARGGNLLGTAASLFFAARGAKALLGGAARAATGGGLVGAVRDKVGTSMDTNREARDRVRATEARRHVGYNLEAQHAQRRRQAEATLAERQQKREQLNANQQRQRELEKRRDALVQGRARTSPGQYTSTLAAIDAQRARVDRAGADLRSELADPKYQAAERFLASADERDPTASERAFTAAADRRLSEVTTQREDSDSNLLAAGIDPAAYASADARQQRAMRAQSRQAMDEDRIQLGWMRDAEGREYPRVPGETNAAAKQQIKAERRARRARDRIYRR